MRIIIPSGYKYGNQSEFLTFKNEIGRYSQTVSLTDGTILVIRNISLPSGTYPAEMKEKVTEYYKRCHDIESRAVLLELAL